MRIQIRAGFYHLSCIGEVEGFRSFQKIIGYFWHLSVNREDGSNGESSHLHYPGFPEWWQGGLRRCALCGKFWNQEKLSGMHQLRSFRIAVMLLRSLGPGNGPQAQNMMRSKRPKKYVITIILLSYQLGQCHRSTVDDACAIQ